MEAEGAWIWSGLRYRAVSWLSDKQPSVLLNSNTPQSTLGSGSQPAQWQKPLINAIPNLSSESHCLLCGPLQLWSQFRVTYNIATEVVKPYSLFTYCTCRIYSERCHQILPSSTQNNTQKEQRKVTSLTLFFFPNNWSSVRVIISSVGAALSPLNKTDTEECFAALLPL